MTPVLVTGLGAISPLGVDCQSSFEAAVAARSAVRRAPQALSAGLPDLLVAQAAAEPQALLDRSFNGLDRATQFALVAAQEAMADAGITEAPADGERFGIFAGIGFGGAYTLDGLYARYFAALARGDAGRKSATVMHPLSVPRMMANGPMAAVSMRYGLRGMGNTYSVACASSAIAAGEALRAIQHGYVDAAVVIGAEAMLTPGSLVAWNALRVMARCDALDPAGSCRPFAVNRSGFVLGEGAAALVLESQERAQRRGARAHAELAGYGSSSDAGHLTAPSVQGQAAAMRQALAHAGLRPDQIHYLNAHGTATEAGDVTECQSIVEVFGPAAQQLPVSSTKAVHGHLIGAGGALELVLALMALKSGSIPPTAHLEQVDPRCGALDLVPLVARHGCRIDAVMSNSFAFGGSNASLVARRVMN
jgi:3-oxoacyl-[acyl-carrier-protein] synthase II